MTAESPRDLGRLRFRLHRIILRSTMSFGKGGKAAGSMEKAEAMTKLCDHAEAIRNMGATALYLFGSTVRDEAHAGSDIDLFVDYDPDGRFNAFDLMGIKLFLEDRLAAAVDLTTRDGLHPSLRDRIERSAVRIF